MAGMLSNKIQRHELKPGDHIYTWRGPIYAHHGIYVSDEKVVHFTRKAGGVIGGVSSFPSNSSGSSGIAYGVISSSLEHFLNGDELYLFKYGVSLMVFLAQARGGTCTLAASDPPEHVIHRAEYLLQHDFGVYDLFKNNCEDFAIYCKTEVLGGSGQIASVVDALASFGLSRLFVTGFPALVAAGFSVYCGRRIVSDILRHRDVERIPVEKLVDSTR